MYTNALSIRFTQRFRVIQRGVMKSLRAVLEYGVKGPGARRRAIKSDSASQSSSSSSSSSDSSASKSFDAAVAPARSEVKPWLEVERGPRVKLDIYKPRRKHEYRRWILKCTHHDGCARNRSVDCAYLIAWNRLGSTMTPDQHQERKLFISPDDVAREVVKLGNRAQPTLELL